MYFYSFLHPTPLLGSLITWYLGTQGRTWPVVLAVAVHIATALCSADDCAGPGLSPLSLAAWDFC